MDGVLLLIPADVGLIQPNSGDIAMMKTARSASGLCSGVLCVVVFLAGAVLLEAADAGKKGDASNLARQILDNSGVTGGVIVHLGCADGRLTAALRAGDSYLVHGLNADAKNVQAAREHIRSLGLYGKVSVERWATKRGKICEQSCPGPGSKT